MICNTAQVITISRGAVAFSMQKPVMLLCRCPIRDVSTVITDDVTFIFMFIHKWRRSCLDLRSAVCYLSSSPDSLCFPDTAATKRTIPSWAPQWLRADANVREAIWGRTALASTPLTMAGAGPHRSMLCLSFVYCVKVALPVWCWFPPLHPTLSLSLSLFSNSLEGQTSCI